MFMGNRHSYTSSGTWTCPAGVLLTVEAWEEGGGKRPQLLEVEASSGGGEAHIQSEKYSAVTVGRNTYTVALLD
jgi:hypothetical protein